MHLILAAYRASDLVSALTFLDRHFPRSVAARRVCVVNDPELVGPARQRAIGWDVVPGSNEFGEFSAWQEGLDHLGADAIDRPVLFANDTVDTHRHFSWWRVAALQRSMARAGDPAIVGFFDAVPGTLTVAGLPIEKWVSTYSFYLTRGALQRLQFRVIRPDLIRACVGGGLEESRFFRQLSPDLDAHLRSWLFGARWYAGGPLTADSRERMTRKAQAIIAEKLLSATCQAAGIERIDPFVQSPVLRFADKAWRKLRRQGLPWISARPRPGSPP